MENRYNYNESHWMSDDLPKESLRYIIAYQPRLGVEDAIVYLPNRVYAHLDKLASTVRVMFFDFSSAFNIICPALLGEKLTVMQVDASLVSWIIDYLTGRPKYVRLQHCV
ncbi:uncharacterized protein LOC132396450 isoform X2 [Hypanus sabinus]|uniref:uncharacterized protein LOC132396450 isoform X2 n=1 Tax=Hypanus sabinus TaxID=79690 RepID=UPI0028C3E372|nr:uncharacterized protein LOC132396450 isoform X2 [Hypanus sabinus]